MGEKIQINPRIALECYQKLISIAKNPQFRRKDKKGIDNFIIPEWQSDKISEEDVSVKKKRGRPAKQRLNAG